MTDDPSKEGAADRSQVAAEQPYEVAYFAKKHGLTMASARKLIAEVGNDRDKLDAAAAAQTSQSTPPKRASQAKRAPRAGTTAKPRSGRKASQQATGAAKSRGATPAQAAAATSASALTDGAKTVVAAVRRSAASARDRAVAAPRAVGKSAGRAIDATKAAGRSRAAGLVGAAAAGILTGLMVNLGRKAVVQAPSVMAGDWLEALKTEHRMALAIFDQIEATSGNQPAKRVLLLAQLKHALGKHAFTEENVIYPALRDWGGKADADKLNSDHGYVKQYLFELDALDKASPAFLSRVAAFRADLQSHIHEEEDLIFPPLHAALDDSRNAELTALANKEGFKLA